MNDYFDKLLVVTLTCMVVLMVLGTVGVGFMVLKSVGAI